MFQKFKVRSTVREFLRIFAAEIENGHNSVKDEKQTLFHRRVWVTCCLASMVR